MTHTEQVRQFLIAFDQTVDHDNIDQRKLYAKLISEEFHEFLTAYIEGNDLKELDGCCDLIWVILGYTLSRGWDFDGAMNEVAASNMSKLDPTTGKPLKRADGKVLKGANFFSPNLTPFLSR